MGFGWGDIEDGFKDTGKAIKKGVGTKNTWENVGKDVANGITLGAAYDTPGSRKLKSGLKEITKPLDDLIAPVTKGLESLGTASLDLLNLLPTIIEWLPIIVVVVAGAYVINTIRK